MKRLKRILRVLANPLVAACLITGAMIIVLALLAPKAKLDASGWASWVQAIGSISAILISLGLADYQLKRQKNLDRLNAAKEAQRAVTFAGEVISDASHTIQEIEAEQRSWQPNKAYRFHSQARIQALHALIQIAAEEKPSIELIRPIIEIKSLLISVEAQATQLDGRIKLTEDRRFEEFWRSANGQLTAIGNGLSNAWGAANLELRDAEDEGRHN